MMKLRVLSIAGVICMVVALSGCVNYGNTHALVTPVGAVGYHTFRPQNRAPEVLSQPNADRIAAANPQNEQQDQDGET